MSEAIEPFFQTNQVTLYHGDCLEVMPQLPDKSIDFILTDLPYGMVACKWDLVIPFEPLWEQYKRLIKPNGAIALFGSQPFTSMLVMSNLKWFKYCWVWDKNNRAGFALANIRPMMMHEDICIFGEGRVKYYPQKIKRQSPVRKTGGTISDCYGIKPTAIRNYTDLYPKSILEFGNASQVGKEHPTQKNTSLLQYLIKTYTLEGETVLDSTCGSGSTLVAARDTVRRAIGIEKDGHYCEIAARRCGQLSIFEVAM